MARMLSYDHPEFRLRRPASAPAKKHERPNVLVTLRGGDVWINVYGFVWK